jgi:hypothetical protein
LIGTALSVTQVPQDIQVQWLDGFALFSLTNAPLLAGLIYGEISRTRGKYVL